MKLKWPERFYIFTSSFVARELFLFIAKQELEMTGEEDEVYKKVGSVLFPQNRQELIQILSKEEQYIRAELCDIFHLF